jgi:hypothetical protein
MARPKLLDLFSGIGGFSLGLERAGFETVAFCEIDPAARRLLAARWPGVPQYDDIANADFSPVGPVDLVTAGFPCQDISSAGLRAGLSGSRSSLFWHVLRAICMVGRPRLLLENVAALLDRGMGDVLGALAEIGYDAEWHCIPASAVGAPHRRGSGLDLFRRRAGRAITAKTMCRAVWTNGAGRAIRGVGRRLGSCTRLASRNGRWAIQIGGPNRWAQERRRPANPGADRPRHPRC